MQILTSFEKHQLTKTLTADFNGSEYPHTFNYLSELLFFKHLCNCNLCNLLSISLTTKINKIREEINTSRFQSNIIPLAINQVISQILADFEHFHIDPAIPSNIHRNCL
jgi:hypothetical protein